MNGKAYRDGDKGTVTLFNSCGRSDGASAVIAPTWASLRRWPFRWRYGMLAACAGGGVGGAMVVEKFS